MTRGANNKVSTDFSTPRMQRQGLASGYGPLAIDSLALDRHAAANKFQISAGWMSSGSILGRGLWIWRTSHGFEPQVSKHATWMTELGERVRPQEFVPLMDGFDRTRLMLGMEIREQVTNYVGKRIQAMRQGAEGEPSHHNVSAPKHAERKIERERHDFTHGCARLSERMP